MTIRATNSTWSATPTQRSWETTDWTLKMSRPLLTSATTPRTIEARASVPQRAVVRRPRQRPLGFGDVVPVATGLVTIVEPTSDDVLHQEDARAGLVEARAQVLDLADDEDLPRGHADL